MAIRKRFALHANAIIVIPRMIKEILSFAGRKVSKVSYKFVSYKKTCIFTSKY